MLSRYMGVKALTDVSLATDREIVLHNKLVKGPPKLCEATVDWQVEKERFRRSHCGGLVVNFSLFSFALTREHADL